MEILGERWTFLILRESFYGVRRFSDMQRNLGIARNILSTRLQTLVGAGILERVLYREEPERYEYRLTAAGRDLYPSIVTLMRWGDRHIHGELGPPVVLRHNVCGHEADPMLVCSHCREELHPHDVTPERGPAASSFVGPPRAELRLAALATPERPVRRSPGDASPATKERTERHPGAEPAAHTRSRCSPPCAPGMWERRVRRARADRRAFGLRRRSADGRTAPARARAKPLQAYARDFDSGVPSPPEQLERYRQVAREKLRGCSSPPRSSTCARRSSATGWRRRGRVDRPRVRPLRDGGAPARAGHRSTRG